MNIFDEICRRNAKNLQKLALIIRLGNKTERTYTFGEMFDAISAFGELLLRDGITAGDRVAIVAESSPEWSISYLAVASLNATSVLLDASLPQQDLIEQLEKSDVRCILASTKVIQKLGKIKQPIFDIYTSPKILLEQPKIELRVANFPTNPEAASIIFSSGTTKKASGILHSHDSLIKSSLMCMRSNKLNSHDLFMAVLPNSHIYGLICQLYGPLLNSSTVCFIEEMTSEALVGAFMNFRPTIFPAVPKIFELLKTQIQMKINSEATTKKLFEKLFPVCLKLRQKTKINLGKAFFKKVHSNFGGQLRILCSAGAPISPETAAFFYGIGFDMLVTYGATETSIPTIGNYGSHITTETCGIPYPDIAIKISESGEILIKTPYKMLGYFGDETATKDAFDKDGWFKSGDLGCVDKKGFVRILGRCKDNIVLANGKKVAPDDIEEAYQGIGGVKELVVCGIAVADGSCDEVHAFFIAENEQEDFAIEQIKARSKSVSQNLKISAIHAVTEIPKTSLQKPKRFLLKQMIVSGEEFHEIMDAKPAGNNVTAAVREAIARVSGSKDFSDGTRLFQELAIDSLGALDLACEIDEKCGVYLEHLLHKDMTVGELIECVISPVVGEQAPPENPYPMRKKKFAYQFFCIFRNLIRGFYKVKVKNDTVLPENSGYIICANHVSNFDYLYLTLNFKKERFLKFCCMAKKELFRKNAFSKLLANICGMIPVDRGGLVADTMEAINGKLKEKWGILIHPEGTRSGNGKMGAFKNGAAVIAIDADVPIVPAYIRGGFDIFPRTKKLPFLYNWKAKCKYQVDVIYGEPILPAGKSPEELMNAIKAAITLLSSSETVVAAN